MARRKNLLSALLLLASTVLAQTVASKTSIADDSKDVSRNDPINNVLPKRVAIARCSYHQSEAGCPGASPDHVRNNTLAQIPHRVGPLGRQGPPISGGAYPESWGPQFSPGHALVGAAIGFGFGAAAGSKNGVRSSLAVGTLVGLLGAAIGAGIPSFPSYYRRHGWDDNQEASRTKPKPAKPMSAKSESVTQVAASQPESTETYQKNDFSHR